MSGNSGDLCEYLFNHLNGLTRAMTGLGQIGNSLDAEGLMPSKQTELTSDFNSNIQHPSTTTGNDNSMLYFVLFVFVCFLVMSFMGRRAPAADEKARYNRTRDNHPHDQNDPVN